MKIKAGMCLRARGDIKFTFSVRNLPKAKISEIKEDSSSFATI